MIKMLRIRIGIVIEPDDGGFYAYCPGLKGLHVGGATEQEAVKNAKDAAVAYLQSLLKHNDPIPLGIVEEDLSFSHFLAKQLSHSGKNLGGSYKNKRAARRRLGQIEYFKRMKHGANRSGH